MRIQQIISPDALALQTATVLVEALQTDDSIEFVGERPDVLHAIGSPTPEVVGAIALAHKRHIATVYTPLGALSHWNKLSDKQLSTCASLPSIIVASGALEQELLKGQAKNGLWLVLNAVTTNSTFPQEMAQKYSVAFHKASAAVERALQASINRKMELLKEQDEKVVHLCRQLLYAQFLAERENIPLAFLSNLSRFMRSSDYDEAHFAEVLQLIGLYEFTSRLEYVMQECASLTEGFMPIALKEDKALLAKVNTSATA